MVVEKGYLPALAALTGAGLALLVSQAELPMTSFAFFCLSVLTAAAVLRELPRRDRDIFNPVLFVSFLFFYYLVLPVFDRLVLFKLYPSGMLVNNGLFFMDLAPEDDRLVFIAVSICIVGVLMFYSGFYSGVARAFVNTLRLRIASSTAVLGNVAFFYLAAGTAATLFIIWRAGGPSAFIFTRWTKRFSEGAYVINNLEFLQRLAVLVGVLALQVYAAERKKKSLWALWFLSAAFVVLFFAVEGGRRVLAELVISTLIVWNYKISRIRVKVVIATAILLFIAMPLLDVFRSFIWLGSAAVVENLDNLDKLMLLRYGTEYNGVFDVLVNLTKRVPSDFNFIYGVSFIKPLLAVFPRSIWPDKPLPVSQLMAERLYPGEKGLSVGGTVIGEAYLNLGVPAVALTMFLFGAAARAVYLYFMADPDNNAAVLIYACLFPVLFEFFRGPVSDALLMTAMLLLLLLPFIRVVRTPLIKTERP